MLLEQSRRPVEVAQRRLIALHEQLRRGVRHMVELSHPAEQFAAAAAELIDALRGCSPAQWQRIVDHEGRTVAAAARQIIARLSGRLEFVQLIRAQGVASLEDLEEQAAQDIERRAPTSAEIVTMLDQIREQVLPVLQPLTEAELAGSVQVGGMSPSLGQLVSHLLIGYVRQQLPGMHRALAGEAPPLRGQLLEQLAALEHEQWMEWTQSLAAQEQLSAERTERWREGWVPYAALPDLSKEADRIFAARTLAIVDEYLRRLIGDDEETKGADDSVSAARNFFRYEIRRRYGLD